MKRIVKLLGAIALVLIVAGTLLAGGAKEQKEIVLNFPSFWVGQDSKSAPVAELIAKFNADNAGKIKIVVEENPSPDPYRTKINASLAAGAVPDLFIFNPDPTTFQYYEGEILMDFTEELKGEWAKDFQEGYIQASTKKGRTKTVPYEIGITPIWYNSDLFKKGRDRGVPQDLRRVLGSLRQAESGRDRTHLPDDGGRERVDFHALVQPYPGFHRRAGRVEPAADSSPVCGSGENPAPALQ
jgi:raffinose/stachyose/melibiose transport system substrate-binding protein